MFNKGKIPNIYCFLLSICEDLLIYMRTQKIVLENKKISICLSVSLTINTATVIGS